MPNHRAGFSFLDESLSAAAPGLSNWAWWSVVLVWLISVAVRVEYIRARPETERQGMGIYGDTFIYFPLASNLVRNHCYSGADAAPYFPSCSKPPAYPFFLAALMECGAQRPGSFRLAQAVGDSLSPLFVFAAACFLFESLPAAFLAALLMAFSPYNIFYARALLSDWLGSTLMALAVACLLAGWRRGRFGWLALSAAVFGLDVLARPAVAPYALVIAALLAAATPGRWKKRAARGGAYLAIVVAVVGVWTARNYLATGRFIAVSTGGRAIGLLKGTWETADNWGKVPREFFKDEAERKAMQDRIMNYLAALAFKPVDEQLVMNDTLLELARERRNSDWAGYLRRCAGRVPILWWNGKVRMFADPEPGPAVVNLLLIGWALSWVAARGRGTMFLALWLLPVVLTAAHFPVHVEPRFTLPAMPALCVLAGGAYASSAQWAIRRIREIKQTRNAKCKMRDRE